MRRAAIFTLVLTTAGLTLVLSSCSNSISPLNSTSAGSIVSLQQANNELMLGMLAPSPGFAPLALNTQKLAKSGLSQLSGLVCPTVNTWGPNADNDLAPATGNITYAACPGTSGVTVSGTFTIADNNDNLAYSGFNAALNNFTLNASSISLTIDGTLGVSRTASSPPTYDINYQVNADITLPSVSGSIDMSGNPTFTSSVTGGTDPYVSGTFSLSGAVTFDTSNGYQGSLTRTGVANIDTGTCPGSFTTGSDIVYTDAQGNTLEIVYDGCGTGNWTLTASGGTSTGTF